MARKEWFETWFDSWLYEKLYADRDAAEASRFVSWLNLHYPPEKYPRCLDMGCGRGRHALLLATTGYRVTGVDLSPKAIEKARQKCKDLEKFRPEFETGDMRAWQGGPFDLVCSLFTSFGYFCDDEQNHRAIGNMAANLRREGILVMDYLNAAFVREQIVTQEDLRLDGMTCRIRRTIEKDMVVKTMEFRSAENQPLHRFEERVKLYGADWFRDCFRHYGLKPHKITGTYDGRPYDPRESPRMIMTASSS